MSGAVEELSALTRSLFDAAKDKRPCSERKGEGQSDKCPGCRRDSALGTIMTVFGDLEIADLLRALVFGSACSHEYRTVRDPDEKPHPMTGRLYGKFVGIHLGECLTSSCTGPCTRCSLVTALLLALRPTKRAERLEKAHR